MSDNVAITAGSGTTIAADDVGGVLHQRVKLSLGADGVANDASAGAGAVGTGTQRVTLASDDPAVAALGAVAGAKVVTDANGTIQQYLRGLVTFLANALGAGTKATASRVTIATDDALITGVGKSAAVTFTPAATSHVANDCNGAAGNFALAAPSGSAFMITDATLEIDGASAEATAWRLYLYSVTPPSATADDGAWDLVSGDRASYLGYIDLGTAADLGSTQWVEQHSINKTVQLVGTGLFGYLVNLTTLTPANVAHIVTLIGAPL